MDWEMVIGLETHVELSTNTKIFCSCTTEFGGDPNTHCCPGCLGMPGTLPVLNKRVVEYAVKAGLALGCNIQNRSVMARKHYFYPDLPKAYQVSQHDLPICLGGEVVLSNGRKIGITRIHIEEDAGKLVRNGSNIYMDNNRGGVPLVEIVTEPDFRSADEVLEYMEWLQTTLRAIGISDGRMQEGSLRCDVNLSLRRPGTEKLGARTEVKNLNSFTSIAAAIEYEYSRHRDILDQGGTLKQETRGFNAETGITTGMRDKENADDYRYFPEPDICPVIVTDDEIEALRSNMPELPARKLRRYIDDLQIAEADAKLLTKYQKVALYFEAAAEGRDFQNAANFILTNMFAHITTEVDREEWNPVVKANQLNQLLELVESNKINRNMAKRIYQQMAESGKDAADFLTEEDLQSISPQELEEIVRRAIAGNERAVNDYLNGKEKAIKAVVGAVMKETRGKADGVETEKLIVSIIKK